MRPDILNPLFAPVHSLDGVGPKLEKALTRLLRGSDDREPARIADLLFHLPNGLIDRRNRPEIAKAPQGGVVTIKLRIDRHEPPPSGYTKTPYKVFGQDETGELALVFFRGQSAWLAKQLPVGETRYVSGTVDWYNGRPTIVHPDYIVRPDQLEELPLVEPVYGLTAGVSQKILAKAVRNAVERVPLFPEWLDGAMRERRGWRDFSASLKTLHEPRDTLDIDPLGPAWQRLAYDELLAGQLALALVRSRMKRAAGVARRSTGEKQHAILSALQFDLTDSQKQAVSEILADMQAPERMLRLLQGDVGSGKTIVALLACAAAVEAGGQAAIMAPTEILARQHLESMQPLCEAAGINVEILTGREKGASRSRIYEAAANGEIDILIGTHALFQAGVEFKDLALGVVDEQHRFGVHQRLALAAKGGGTDILVMTATPIPRTLVLTFFGDMDVSRLSEKPAGRQPIRTNAISLDRLDELVERVRTAIASGEKVYWICPLVEESDELPVTAAEDRFKSLEKLLGVNVGLVHGRMKPAEKDRAMDDFKNGVTRLLVATTVIEVGVDVPDATIMVIEHAERFGLAQLHQLRGRVGRGSKPSTCLLVYKPPLGEVASARIRIMRETDDGFLIAEEDLKLRGEGEILGTRQSGSPGFQIARIDVHSELLEMARDDARLVMATDPQLQTPRGEALRVLLYLFGRDEAVRLLRAG